MNFKIFYLSGAIQFGGIIPFSIIKVRFSNSLELFLFYCILTLGLANKRDKKKHLIYIGVFHTHTHKIIECKVCENDAVLMNIKAGKLTHTEDSCSFTNFSIQFASALCLDYTIRGKACFTEQVHILFSISFPCSLRDFLNQN